MMNNTLFRPSAIKENRRKFNPDGFDLAAALKAREAEAKAPPKPKSLPKTASGANYLKGFSDFQSVELISNASEAEATLVIEAAYKQVFGNAHLMESERLATAESQLRSGQITVMEFVRQLAKSERYRALFFDKCPNLRAVELNFKHLLGRAPESQAEVSQHISLLAKGGFDAEIDSYLDSDEYFQSFGTTIVPYYRGYKTQTGKNLTGFTHAFQLLRGASSSDKSMSGNTLPQLQTSLLRDKSSEIQPLSTPPVLVPAVLFFKPTPRVEKPIENLDCVPRYKSPEFLTEPVSPNTWLKEFKAREAVAKFSAQRRSEPIKASRGAAVEDVEIAIRAAYKQVFGNAYLMESERFPMAEAMVKEGKLTIKGFIRELAQSDLYRSLFFESCPNIRAVELNFKHLLGRAPDSSQEVADHLFILEKGGFAAEIDAYLNSQEYQQNFGDDTVPYYVGYKTQTGKNVAGYNRIFEVVKSDSSSDRSTASDPIFMQRPRLQKALLDKPKFYKKSKPVFNPEGFDLARALGIGGYQPAPEIDPYLSISSAYIRAFADSKPLESAAGDAVETIDLVIEATYKQVFGNAHLMESERLPQVESQFRSGQITVMEFVRLLAKSNRYRDLFFSSCSNLRAIELNFKHLLGRAPESHAEISQHIQILADGGFDAEIDAYLDSDEYFQSFGTDTVPYYRGYKTQLGKTLSGYTRSFQLLPGASSSDKSTSKDVYAALDQNLLSDRSHQIQPLSGNLSLDDLPTQAPSSPSNEYVAAIKARPTYPKPTGLQSITYNYFPPVSPQPVQYQPITLRPQLDLERARVIETRPFLEIRDKQLAVARQTQYYKAVANVEPIKFNLGSSDQDKEVVIRALYKQVLGNAYVMESERLAVAESQLKMGNINVAEFVGRLAKSDLYKSRFIDNYPRYRVHELNFIHLLGRAPDDYQEILYHNDLIESQGYEADIDAYTNSDEYQAVFGKNIVPYYRGNQSKTAQKLSGYPNIF